MKIFDFSDPGRHSIYSFDVKPPLSSYGIVAAKHNNIYVSTSVLSSAVAQSAPQIRHFSRNNGKWVDNGSIEIQGVTGNDEIIDLILDEGLGLVVLRNEMANGRTRTRIQNIPVGESPHQWNEIDLGEEQVSTLIILKGAIAAETYRLRQGSNAGSSTQSTTNRVAIYDSHTGENCSNETVYSQREIRNLSLEPIGVDQKRNLLFLYARDRGIIYAVSGARKNLQWSFSLPKGDSQLQEVVGLSNGILIATLNRIAIFRTAKK